MALNRNTAPIKQDDEKDAQITHFESRLASKAPINGTAKIISRSAPEGGVVTYTLQIGTVSIPDVSAFEIYDYVSPHDLEVFENQLFEQEIASQEILERDRLAAKLQSRQQARRSNQSGSSISPSTSDDESVSGVSVSGDNNTTTRVGRNGRHRPTYTHFYPKQRAPRGSSKNTPSTEVATPTSRRQGSMQSQSTKHANKRDNKRRRLNKDHAGSGSKSVNEIASLNRPIQPPTTMEKAASNVDLEGQESDAMDVDDDDDEDEDEDDEDSIINPRSINPAARLTRSISSAGSEIKGASASSKVPAGISPIFRERAAPATKGGSTSSPMTKQQPVSAKERLAAASAPSAGATTTNTAVKTPRQTSASLTKGPSSSAAATATALPRQPLRDFELISGSEPEGDDEGGDSSDEDVYSVERIVAHNLSDPRTHDTSVHGSQPVMLYQVKWEGYDELTWEPATSFEDKEILDEYWAEQRQKELARKGAPKDHRG